MANAPPVVSVLVCEVLPRVATIAVAIDTGVALAITAMGTVTTREKFVGATREGAAGRATSSRDSGSSTRSLSC